ncbi:MAG: MFS transporter [Phycisphaerae bacterium]|jgi:MFS family permease
MADSSRPEPALPDWLVGNRNFVLLWAAYGISAVGDHLSEMALLVERNALEGEHATRIQALITFGFFLPFVILGPLGGWWADRFSRKWTMIGTDILRAGVMLSLIWTVRPLVAWFEPLGMGDYAIVLPLLVTGALAAFFSPSRQALLPTLIRQDQLVRANAMISALGTIGAILSAVLGGYIVHHLGKNWNYSLDTVTFLLSAVLLTFILMSRTRAVPHPKLTGVWQPTLDGFRYVAHHRRVLQLIIFGTVFWGAAGVVISVVPGLVRDVFGGDITDAGMYRGLIGVGLAAGAAVMTVIGPAMPIPLAMLASLAAGTFWLFLLAGTCALHLGAGLAGTCLLGIGASGSGLLVTIMATLQRFVPDSRRGRVFGVSDTCTMAAIVATTGILGVPKIPHIDKYIPLLLAGAGLGLGVATWWAWRGYRRDDPFPPLTSLLRKVAVFYARLLDGVRRTGPCTVPREGPVLVALGGDRMRGALGLVTTCPHRLPRFLDPPPGATWWLTRLGATSPAAKDLDSRCAGLLDAGECVAVNVAREPNEPARVHVGRLALRDRAVVVPCYVGHASADGDKRHLRVRYGRPVDLSATTAEDDAQRLILAQVDALAAEVQPDGA